MDENRFAGGDFVGTMSDVASTPRRPVGDRTNRVGFVVDVVSYGERSAPEQEHLQMRLQTLLHDVVADLGGDLDEVDHDSGTGDGLVVFLPTGADPAHLLPDVLRAMAARLTADNERWRDRIRLRVAVGSGVVDHGSNGLSGPLAVNISRLVDSEPLRRAVREHPEADLVVLVLDTLCRDAVVPGYAPLSVDRIQLVDVALHEFVEQAGLWVSTGQGR